MRQVFVLIVVFATLAFVIGANTGKVQGANGVKSARLNAGVAGPARSKRSVAKLNANGVKSGQAKLNAAANLKGGHGGYGYDSYGSYESYCDPYDPYCDSYESYSYSYESYCDPYDPYCDSYEYYKKK